MFNPNFSQTNPFENQERKNLDAFNVLINKLKEYNEQFGLGRMIAMAISDEPRNEPKTSFKEVDEYTKETQQMAGLDIEPVKVKGQMMITSSGSKNSRELRINIEDAKKFNIFLSSLQKGTLTSEDVESLKFVIESLLKQIHTEYDFTSEEEDRIFNLFAGVGEIITNYQKLDLKNDNGLSHSVEPLSKYLEVSRSGYLKEYITAESSNILPKELGKDNFGPSSWQRDNSPDFFVNKYWGEKAFATLDEIKRNPNAKEFYHTILDHLKKCIEFAKSDCGSKIETYKEEKNDHLVEHFTKLYQAIPQVEEKLNSYN